MLIQRAAAKAVPLYEDTALSLALELDATNVEHKQPARLIICLDRSGSMAGAALRSAQHAINELYTRVLAERALASNILLTFENRTTRYDLDCVSASVCAATVNSIRASGGTSFYSVLQSLQQEITMTPEGTSFFVAFFTDGQDTSGLSNRSVGRADADLSQQAVVQGLKRMIAAKKAFVQIHTLGFSNDHDARFLAELTRAGSEEGTFHFIKGAEDIRTTMPVIKDLVLSCSFLPSLQLYIDANHTLNIPLTAGSRAAAGPEATVALKGKGFIKALPAGITFLNGKVGDQDVQVDISYVEAEPGQQLLETVEYVHERVRALSASITSGSLSHQELQQIEAKEYSRLRELVAAMDRAACAHRGASARRALRGPIMEAAGLLNSLFANALGPALTSTLTNDKIATLNALAYKHVTASRLNLKLEKTAAENVAKLAESEAQLSEQVKRLNLDALELDEAEVQAQGVCNVTLQTYVDALRDVDCMCLGLDVSRPEAAIADPTRVIIKAILPTFVTAEAFLEGVTFALDNNPHDVEGVHGGFGPAHHSAKVMPGAANENLTGVLPLFINSAHWTVARAKLKPILGWTCTLNMLGFTYQQVKVVPFLVLHKAVIDCKQQPVDFRQRALSLVMDVCMALYREGAAIREEIFEANGGLKFLSGPLHRTVDVVPNIGVLLTYYLCAAMAGDLKNITPEQWQELTGALIEEALRRSQPQSSVCIGKRSDTELCAVLAIMDEHDIWPFVDPVLEANGEMPIPTRDTLWPQLLQKGADFDWASRLDNAATHKVLAGLAKGLNALGSQLYILQLVKHCATNHDSSHSLVTFLADLQTCHQSANSQRNAEASSVPGLHKSVAAALPRFSLEQYTAVWMQNRRTPKNNERREWIEDGHYVNPFRETSLLLANWWALMVLEGVQEELSNMKHRLSVCRAENRERNFQAAENVEEAAAAASGTYIGKLDMRGLIVGLHRTPAAGTSAKEKMQVLMAGEHNGERIFQDKGPTTAWQPSRRNACQFVRNNHATIPCEEALRMFPHLKPETIKEWYRRLQEEAGDGMGNGRQKRDGEDVHSALEIVRKRARRS